MKMTRSELEAHAFWDRAIDLSTGEVYEEDEEGSDGTDVHSARFLLRVLDFLGEGE
jgi:hypothetical protein